MYHVLSNCIRVYLYYYSWRRSRRPHLQHPTRSAADKRGEDLGLSTEEIAFYDALANNQSAKDVMGDAQLRVIATALVTQVRKSVTIDWTLRESAQAKIRVMVKRILNKFGYPPDLQDAAVQTVLAQAKLLCAEWA